MRVDVDVKLLINRRTKIIATLGPSSSDSDTIERLIRSGASIFRLNMSHGSHEGHRERYLKVRAAAEKLDRPVAVLADLCGPKIRVGCFEKGRIVLATGEDVTVTTRDVTGGPHLIPSQYSALAGDVKPGDRILLDDGNIELSVQSVAGTEIGCRVVADGVLSDHKGMNLPGVSVSAPSLTPQDITDARFALSLGVDFLALSFVRRAADVESLRELVVASDCPAAIVAKIEKPEALENIDSILKVADAIMVARGDLGVELPPQAVPAAQDQLIDLARAHRKPVIVATQMLESMIEHSRPTRAEVTDVANAVRCGADALMLSAETASGRHPVEAVRIMDGIARQTEGYLWRQSAFGSLSRKPDAAPPMAIEDALSESVAHLSRNLRARAITVISTKGRSVAVMSSSRPAAPIVAICPDRRSGCIAALLWGVIPVVKQQMEERDSNSIARQTALDLGLAEPGQIVLLVGGFSSDPTRNSPSVTIVTV